MFHHVKYLSFIVLRADDCISEIVHAALRNFVGVTFFGRANNGRNNLVQY